MARSVWSGSISFGLVNVGVKAYSAIRDQSVHLHQIDRASGTRVRNQKVAGHGGPPVAADDISMGYEVADGRYVLIDPDDIAALRPTSTRSLDITAFVELSAIDPVHYERTYWLAPAGDGAEQAYRLLLATMEDQGRVGIGSVVMRNTEHLAAIRPYGGALAMSTMRFAGELVPREDVEDLPERGDPPDDRQLALARQVLDSLADEWEPDRYHDTYAAALRQLIEQEGEVSEIDDGSSPQGVGAVLDLMAALEASVRNEGEAEAAPGRKRSRKKAPKSPASPRRTA